MDDGKTEESFRTTFFTKIVIDDQRSAWYAANQTILSLIPIKRSRKCTSWKVHVHEWIEICLCQRGKYKNIRERLIRPVQLSKVRLIDVVIVGPDRDEWSEINIYVPNAEKTILIDDNALSIYIT